MLPTFKDLNGNVSKEILAASPRNTRAATQIKTGAIERTSGVSMGENLRKERILGNRPPIEKIPPAENNGALESEPPIRNTGAVKRHPRVESTPSNGEVPIRQSPENGDLLNTNRIRPNGGNSNNENESQPVRKPRIRSDEREIAPPVYNPPPQREERLERQQPQPPRRERQEEPIRQEPPRQESHIEAPTRVEPRREEPVRQQPAPQQEPPPTEKPAAPTNEVKGKPEKDG